MNKRTAIGRFATEPETKTIPSANGDFDVLNFRFVANSGNNKVGDFFTVEARGKQADFVKSYFNKGSMAYIEASANPRKFTNKAGEEQTAVTWNLTEIQFMGSKSEHADTSDMASEAVEPDAGPDPF